MKAPAKLTAAPAAVHALDILANYQNCLNALSLRHFHRLRADRDGAVRPTTALTGWSMTTALRSEDAWHPARPVLVALAMLTALSLGGCGSISEKVSESMGSMPAIGLPASAPERPATRMDYPAVHDMPTPRSTAVLTSNEQRDLEKELVSARDQQQTSAKPPAAPEPAPESRRKPAAKPAAKPATKPASRPVAMPAAATAPSPIPASSSRTIY